MTVLLIVVSNVTVSLFEVDCHVYDWDRVVTHAWRSIKLETRDLPICLLADSIACDGTSANNEPFGSGK